MERELAAGASRALRWADALRALRLCVRVQEAGWMWSGGFELDTPGDMFIKIRWVLRACHPVQLYSSGECCDVRPLLCPFELDTPGDMFIKFRWVLHQG